MPQQAPGLLQGNKGLTTRSAEWREQGARSGHCKDRCSGCLFRKVRGALPALTDAEMARYRSALYGVAAAVGHVPRVSLAGRNRYRCPLSPLLNFQDRKVAQCLTRGWPLCGSKFSHREDQA